MACSVCGARANGVHFHVLSCLACAAFFRRTIALERNYKCQRDANCTVDQYVRNVCRACRLQKCRSVGMKTEDVQPQRGGNKEKTSTKNSAHCCARMKATSSSELPNEQTFWTNSSARVLDHIEKSFKEMIEIRNQELSPVIHEQPDDSAFEEPQAVLSKLMEAKKTCLKLAAQMFGKIVKFMKLENPRDNTILFKSFVIYFEIIDFCHLNVHSNWIETNKVLCVDGTWLNLNELDKFYQQGQGTILKADPTETANLFMPAIEQMKQEVAVPMQLLDMDNTELYALIGLTLFDRSGPDLSYETKTLCRAACNKIFRELFEHYNDQHGQMEAERCGSLVLLMSGLRRHAIVAKENFQIMKVFRLFELDQFFDEIYD